MPEAPDLVSDFYDAVLDPGRWAVAWERTALEFGATSGNLMIQTAHGIGPIALAGYDDTALKLYNDHFCRVDLWAQSGAMRPAPRSDFGRRWVPDKVYERSEIWNDFGRFHVGAFRLLGGAITLRPGSVALIGLHRRADAIDFDEEDRLRLDGLIPHIQRALQLAQRLQQAKWREQISAAALDAIACALVITDSTSRVLYTNAAADSLLRTRDGIAVRHDTGLVAETSTETLALRKLLGDSASGGSGGAVRISRRSGRPPLVALVCPLPSLLAEAAGGSERSAVLVSLQQPGETNGPSREVLAQVFGLTAAEARLATCLVEGARLDEIAERGRVSLATVKTQLSAVLGKTGCARQSDLVRVLATLGITRPEILDAASFPE